jgi:WhiB family redox-sensing transcriptional regulator
MPLRDSSPLPKAESAGWVNDDRIIAVDRPEWQKKGSCREAEDPAIFFPSPGDTDALRSAKAMCNSCPVVVTCLKYALKNNERYGIWGGKSTRERLLILRAKRMLEKGEEA